MSMKLLSKTVGDPTTPLNEFLVGQIPFQAIASRATGNDIAQYVSLCTIDPIDPVEDRTAIEERSHLALDSDFATIMTIARTDLFELIPRQIPADSAPLCRSLVVPETGVQVGFSVRLRTVPQASTTSRVTVHQAVDLNPGRITAIANTPPESTNAPTTNAPFILWSNSQLSESLSREISKGSHCVLSSP
jgi:hypothetical protein